MKSHLFLLAFISLFLTACSGDDEGVSYSEADLIGKWYEQSGNIPQCEKDFIEFKTTHAYEVVRYIMVPVGNTYEYQCQAINGMPTLYGQTWMLKGSKIDFTYGYDTPDPPAPYMTMKIITLTPDMLQLKNEEGDISTYTAN